MDNGGWQISNGGKARLSASKKTASHTGAKKPALRAGAKKTVSSSLNKPRREEWEESLETLHQLQLEPPVAGKTFWVLTDERNVMLATSDISLKKWQEGKAVFFKKASWIDDQNLKIHQQPVVIYNPAEFQKFAARELKI